MGGRYGIRMAPMSAMRVAEISMTIRTKAATSSPIQASDSNTRRNVVTQETLFEIDDPEFVALVDEFVKKRDAMQAAVREFAGDGKEEPGAKGRLLNAMKERKKKRVKLKDDREVERTIKDPTENVKVKAAKPSDD
jgi:hypothetical protein